MNETFTLGHRCKNRKLFKMMTEEEEEAYAAEIGSDEVTGEEATVEDVTVSINANDRKHWHEYIENERGIKYVCF